MTTRIHCDTCDVLIDPRQNRYVVTETGPTPLMPSTYDLCRSCWGAALSHLDSRAWDQPAATPPAPPAHRSASAYADQPPSPRVLPSTFGEFLALDARQVIAATELGEKVADAVAALLATLETPADALEFAGADGTNRIAGEIVTAAGGFVPLSLRYPVAQSVVNAILRRAEHECEDAS